MAQCCIRHPHAWPTTPTGTTTTLGPLNNKTYVTGPADSPIAIMVIHDLLSWEWPNTRLLADHYAKEVGCRVWVPDFFGGETLDAEALSDQSKWAEIDVPGYMGRNSKEIREREIFACARAIRDMPGNTKLGVVGFCFGGWAVFRLGAKTSMYQNRPLVECISTAHPTWLTKEEIDNVGVPVQILAPEHDTMFTEELKEYAQRVIPTLGLGGFDYQPFEGLEHAFATRGKDEEEKRGVDRAKEAVVGWMRQWLCDKEGSKV